MYYVSKVSVVFEDDKGRPKKKTEQYLVDAVSVTDAEVKTTEYFRGSVSDFEVVSVVQSKIASVIA